MKTPAVYLGEQQGWGDQPGFHLYNLTAPIPGHPAGSTVSGDTLTRLGYPLPNPAQKKRQAVKDSFNPFFKEDLWP